MFYYCQRFIKNGIALKGLFSFGFCIRCLIIKSGHSFVVNVADSLLKQQQRWRNFSEALGLNQDSGIDLLLFLRNCYTPILF